MALAATLVIVCTAVVALWFAARAATTICVLEIDRGKVTVRRGGIAPRVLHDIGDVAVHPPVERATLRIVRDHGAAVVTFTGGLSEAQQQQVRNVIGTTPLAKLVNARGRR
jgi:hypothetical protein